MFVQIIGRGIGMMFAIFTLGILTRYLGTTQFGYYTTVLSFLQIFGILIDFGLQMVTLQLISDPTKDEGRMLSNIFTFRLVTAFILFLAPLVSLFFPYPVTVKVGIAITTLAYISISLGNILVGLFQKRLSMTKVALADAVNKILFFLLTLVAVYFHLNILWVFTALTASNMVYFFLLFFYSQKIFPVHLLFEKKEWLFILSQSWPLAVTIGLNLIYFKADTIILSLFRTQDEVGLYGAAYRILEVLINIAYLFLGLIFPILTASWAVKNFERFQRALQKGFDALSLVSLPIFFGTLVLGRPIMMAVAGKNFEISGEILKILMLATVAVFLSAVFGYGIVAMKKQKHMLIFYGVNALISIIAYGIFIPHYSYWAAAWITAYSEIFILVASAFFLKKYLGFFPRLEIFFKAAFASILMAGFLYLLKFLPLIALLFFATALYAILLLLLGVISKKTLMEIMKTKED